MVTTGGIYDFINDWADFSTQLDFDNAGLLVGDRHTAISNIMVTLDITAGVIEQARNQGCQLIVSHHPVIFNPIKALQSTHPVYLLASNGIHAICAHTNMDAAVGGVNECLAKIIGLHNIVGLEEDGMEKPALARIGNLPKSSSPKELAVHVKSVLGCCAVKYSRTGGEIKKIAVCGGSGAEHMFAAVAAGADALVTADIKYHEWLLAESMGIVLLDAGHFATERVVNKEVAKRLSQAFPNIEVSIAVETEPMLCE